MLEVAENIDLDPDFILDIQKSSLPEEGLWTEVLLQAMRDAEIVTGRGQPDRFSGLKFLVVESRQFEVVIDNSGLDRYGAAEDWHAFFRKKYQEEIKEMQRLEILKLSVKETIKSIEAVVEETVAKGFQPDLEMALTWLDSANDALERLDESIHRVTVPALEVDGV